MAEIQSASDFVKINISNSQTDMVAFEKKYPKSLTIADFKLKLEVITGGCAATMQLHLFRGNTMVCAIDNDTALLGSYPIDDGMRIHVVDNFLYIADSVEKFELSDDAYAQKQNTVRDYLKRNRLGKYDEEETKKIEERKQAQAAEEAKLYGAITVGDRCSVSTKNQPDRIGTVMYKGEVSSKTGNFVGVKFDYPVGVNDGSAEGVKYFDCLMKYGSFVPPRAVTVGDFPVEDDGLDDEI